VLALLERMAMGRAWLKKVKEEAILTVVLRVEPEPEASSRVS
jgi:hypothetical protein